MWVPLLCRGSLREGRREEKYKGTQGCSLHTRFFPLLASELRAFKAARKKVPALERVCGFLSLLTLSLNIAFID